MYSRLTSSATEIKRGTERVQGWRVEVERAWGAAVVVPVVDGGCGRVCSMRAREGLFCAIRQVCQGGEQM